VIFDLRTYVQPYPHRGFKPYLCLIWHHADSCQSTQTRSRRFSNKQKCGQEQSLQQFISAFTKAIHI